VAISTEPHYHCNHTILSSTTKKPTEKIIFLVERFAPGANSEQIFLIQWQIPTLLAAAEGTQLGATALGFVSASLYTSSRTGHESTQLSFQIPGCAHGSGSYRKQASFTTATLQVYSTINLFFISKQQFFSFWCQSLGYSKLPAVTLMWKRARRSVWEGARVPVCLFNSRITKLWGSTEVNASCCHFLAVSLT